MAVRITRQAVEVMALIPSGEVDLGAENTLSMGNTASLQKTVTLTAANPLVLSHTAEVFRTLELTAENTLTLVNEANLVAMDVTATHTLSLSQDVTMTVVRELTAANTLSLSQSTSVFKTLDLSAGNSIALTHDGVLTATRMRTATNVLQTITEEFVDGTLDLVTVITGLNNSASAEASLGKGTTNALHMTQQVSMVHLKADATILSASNTLSLSNSATDVTYASATNTLSLSHSADVDNVKPVGHTLTLSHSASVQLLRQNGGENQLNLGQAVSFILERPFTKHIYSPFVGSSDDPNAPEPPPTCLPGRLEGQDQFRLVYPASGTVTDSIILRAPNLGNGDRLSFDRVNVQSRGGTLIIYADPQWPKVQTLLLTFSGLKKGEAENLQEFIHNYLGDEIGMIDWEARFWKGVIVDPNGAVVEDERGAFTASFEFEGEIAEWTEQELPEATNCMGYQYGTPRVRNRGTRQEIPCCYEAPEMSGGGGGGDGVDDSQYEAETDSNVIIGVPIYMKSNGHVDLAQANDGSTAFVAGLCLENKSATTSVVFAAEGQLTRSDWTAIIGSLLLTPGARYYLSPTTAGRITATAPTTDGQYVVRVGRAISTTVLDIEIEDPIKL